MLLRFLTLAFVLMMTTPIFAQTPKIETGVSRDLAKWRAANYSDVRYKLNITLEKGAPLMKGDIKIRVKLTDEGAKNDLVLDWRTTQFANDKDKPYANIGLINESLPLNVSIEQEHILIPKRNLKAGENVIKINFASPIKTTGAAVTRYVDKEDGAEYVYSLFVPSDASTAFPVFDQPDLKARFQLIVNAPMDWKVTSNEPFYFLNTNYDYVPESIEEVRKGNIRRREESKTRGDKNIQSEEIFELSQKIPPAGRKLYYFYETKPISTYVFAFAAGEFVQFDEQGVFFNGEDFLPLNKETTPHGIQSTGDGKYIRTNSLIYVRKSQAEKFKQHAAEVFRLNREGVKFLEDWFDYKFPFPKYDLVLIPEFPFGGMEHAGCTFLREDRVIFPTEPTKNDYITRANVIFHEAAHQWFGDTVTMKWFDDLWLKEGFAEFMAYKTLEKVLPEYNAWKVFYERNKQAAYLTDVTRGTTPIYQEIPNLASAKSAYGNIVYRKAPSFLRQAEFYLGEKEFQTAVRAFLKKHEFANAEWTALVNEFETASKKDLKTWAEDWVKQRGLGKMSVISEVEPVNKEDVSTYFRLNEINIPDSEKSNYRNQAIKLLVLDDKQEKRVFDVTFEKIKSSSNSEAIGKYYAARLNSKDDTAPNGFEFLITRQKPVFIFPNYQDYGYGIFLLDEKSRAYVLANIQNEKDDFLRSMMWGSLWDSVRFYELAPEDYVELVIKTLALSPAFTRQSSQHNSSQTNEKPSKDGTQNNAESDESTIATLLNRVSIAMNYYLSEPPAVAGGLTASTETSQKNQNAIDSKIKPSATADGSDKAELAAQLEKLLIEKMQNAPTLGQKITFYRAFLSLASSENGRNFLKEILRPKTKDQRPMFELKTKDKFDIVTKLIILGDADGLKLLAELEKIETDDAAKRYAYAARAGIPTAENKAKYWNDFVNDKEISESWIEAAFPVWNSPKHADLTLPYLEKALAELPNLKRNRKIFFVNGWLSAFIGGQKSEEALNIVNKFLADNPNLDKDLRLKILENADGLERAVKIRAKFAK